MALNITLAERIAATEANRQEVSPLFALPPEIRSHIFANALADYPDHREAKQYSVNTYYSRPSYFARRRTDVALLATCRAAYNESWYMPFTQKEQIHWLGSRERAPPEYELSNLQQDLCAVAEQQGEDAAVIDRLRVFAQMWALESDYLAILLQTRYLQPRTITLTVRHTDWWFWEDDKPLRFKAEWLAAASEKLQPVTNEIYIELETTKRREGQLTKIAQQMTETWFFKKPDGTVLFADSSKGLKTERWTGTSIWDGMRWVRDEISDGLIEYVIIVIQFLPDRAIKRRGGQVSDIARANSELTGYPGLNLKLSVPDKQPVAAAQAYVYVDKDGNTISESQRALEGSEDNWDSNEEESYIDHADWLGDYSSSEENNEDAIDVEDNPGHL